MVEFGYFEAAKPYQTLVTDKLRPGDNSTHFYRWPAPLLDKNGKVAPYLEVARKRGVKFDVGHGGGGVHFPQSQPFVRPGFLAPSIFTHFPSRPTQGAIIEMLHPRSPLLA